MAWKYALRTSTIEFVALEFAATLDSDSLNEGKGQQQHL